jgi:hypothetical protein
MGIWALCATRVLVSCGSCMQRVVCSKYIVWGS